MNSLIVLPFKNLNMPEDSIWPQALFQIIQGLETSGLKIVPYEVAFLYKTTPVSDADIAKKHKVNNVLKGTLALKDSKIVFEVELRRIKPDGILLSRSFSSQSEKDCSAAFNDIATVTAEKLGAKLIAPRTPPTPNDPEANQYYSYGLMIYRNRYLTSKKPEDFEVVLTNFQKALDLEPTSAIVCWQLGMLYEGRFNEEKKSGDEKLMMQYLRRAYELEPGLAESNMAMGWYHFNREDHDRAYSFFKKALVLDRGSADVHLHVGSFLRSLGLYEQALRHYLRALLVAPTPDDFAVWHQLPADCYDKLGDVPRSAKLLKTAIEVSPDRDLILDYAVCLIAMKEFAEAERQLKAAHDLGADANSVRRRRALLYAAMGQRELALELMKTETSPSHPLVTSTDALLGLRDKALRGIESARGEKGFRENRWYRYTYLVLLNNTFFDKLRDEPAFRAMLQKEKVLFEDRVKKFGDL